MQILRLDALDLHYREDGDPSGRPVVFANSLGTDLRLWDQILPLLPKGLRLIRYDKRGHGLTDCPRPPYRMGALVSDLEALLDHLEVKDAVMVGCSVGGLIAQGLAVKRMDQIRAMVLTNTAAKIGTHEMWQDRIDTVIDKGIGAIADAILERWFSKEFLKAPELTAWRNMLTRTPDAGYAGVSAAIQGTDFYTTTSSLTLPTLAMTGTEDGSTPPDLVRETAALIKGSRFELIRGVGHLPMVEKPEVFADLLNGFLKEVGHV